MKIGSCETSLVGMKNVVGWSVMSGGDRALPIEDAYLDLEQ